MGIMGITGRDIMPKLGVITGNDPWCAYPELECSADDVTDAPRGTLSVPIPGQSSFRLLVPQSGRAVQIAELPFPL